MQLARHFFFLDSTKLHFFCGRSPIWLACCWRSVGDERCWSMLVACGWRSTDDRCSMVVEWQFGWLLVNTVGRLGWHNFVEGTGRVMVDEILVQSVDCRPLMSNFKVDDYWSKAPVECWSMIFQYGWSIANHWWVASRSMTIGRRHRSSAGRRDFSTFGRLDGICIVRRSMGRLVEWPLDGRFIVNGWLGRVDYLCYSVITRSKSIIWSQPVLVMSRPFVQFILDMWSMVSRGHSVHMFVIHQSIYIHTPIDLCSFSVSGGVLVPMFLSWSILNNTSTIWATSSCRVSLFPPPLGSNYLHMLLLSPRPNGDNNDARCWDLSFHITFKQTETVNHTRKNNREMGRMFDRFVYSLRL